jgi:hypothetical protein
MGPSEGSRLWWKIRVAAVLIALAQSSACTSMTMT